MSINTNMPQCRIDEKKKVTFPKWALLLGFHSSFLSFLSCNCAYKIKFLTHPYSQHHRMLCKSKLWTLPHKYISTHPPPTQTYSVSYFTDEEDQGHTVRDKQELKSRTRTVSSLKYTCIVHQQLQGIFFPELSRVWIINQSIVLHTKSPKGNSVQDASAFKMQLRCSTLPETDVMVLIILRQTRQGSTKRGKQGQKLSCKPDCRMKSPRTQK